MTVGSTVRAIVPYYLGDDLIRACVASLLASEPPLAEVIVVDNSPRRFDAGAIGCADPRLTVIRAAEGIGFGRACNLGLAHAQRAGTDVAVLLNQDAVVPPTCVAELVEVLAGRDLAFAAAPFAMTYDGTRISPFFVSHYLQTNAAYVGDLVSGTVQACYPTPYNGLNGACLALAMRHLPQVGCFDPVFHMYGEEWELFQRAIHAGLELLLVPHARFHHVHTNASGSGPRAAEIALHCRRGMLIRLAKNPKHGALLVLMHLLLAMLLSYRQALWRRDLGLLFSRLGSDLALVAKVPQLLAHRQPEGLARGVTRSLEADRSPAQL